MEGGREGSEAGRIGYRGRERGVSGVGGGSPRLGFIFKPLANPAVIPTYSIRSTLPLVSECLLWEVSQGQIL